MAWSGSGVYGQTVFVDALGTTQSGLDLDLETHMVALYGTSHTPDYSAESPGYSSTGEIEGTGYTAGGAALTGTTLTQEDGVATWDADDPQWEDSTLSGVRGCDIYADSMTGDPLIMSVDFGTTYETSDGALLLTVNALGLFTIDFIPS